MRRATFAAACVAGLLSAGCIEGEQTFTINPDGSGKVRLDVIMAPPIDGFGGGPSKKGDDSIEAMLRKHSRPLLESPGVDAWKDVSTSFASDGRLKFSGTAYFKKIDTYELRNVAFLKSEFALNGAATGPLTLLKANKKKNEQPGLASDRPKKTASEIAKMSDSELDEYILKDRIEYQSSKPLVRAILTDAKIKTTFVLPGVVSEVRGFKTEANGAVSYTVDGNGILKAVEALFAQENSELRKIYRSKEGVVSLLETKVAGLPSENASATVAKPGKPLFDYDAEVKAAREAYPELRKKLKLGADVKLPDGTESKRP